LHATVADSPPPQILLDRPFQNQNMASLQNLAGRNRMPKAARRSCRSTVCQPERKRGTPPMTTTTATLPEQPANLTALQLQLLDLATRSKPVSQDRRQEIRGPVLVIRSK
jgi:hypothetical protein